MLYLYHGTDIDSAKSIYQAQQYDVEKCSTDTDFGQGFYTTNDPDAATKWAFRKAETRNKKPALLTIMFDDTSAKDFIEFFSDDLRWGRFVINNRNGIQYVRKIAFQEHNLDAKYMITYGRIADIDVIDVADELNESGKMLTSLDRILNKNYAMQYVFHLNEANQYIRKITYRPLT